MALWIPSSSGLVANMRLAAIGEAMEEGGRLAHLAELSRHIERSAQQPGVPGGLREESSTGSLGGRGGRLREESSAGSVGGRGGRLREESSAGSLGGRGGRLCEESSAGSSGQLGAEQSASSLKHWALDGGADPRRPTRSSPGSGGKATKKSAAAAAAPPRKRLRASPAKARRQAAAGREAPPRERSPPPAGWEFVSPRGTSPSSPPSGEFLPEWWWAKHEAVIASIVTAHWRSFALSRRAIVHAARRALGVTWAEWLRSVAAARAKLRRAVIWDHRRRYLAYGRAFAAWAALRAAHAARRAAYVAVLHVRARGLYAACLRAWLAYGEAHARKRQQLDRADKLAATQMLARALAGWTEHLQVGRPFLS